MKEKKKVEGNNVPKTEITASKYSAAGTRSIWDIYDFCSYWMRRKNDDTSLALVGVKAMSGMNSSMVFLSVFVIEEDCTVMKKIWVLFSGDVCITCFYFCGCSGIIVPSVMWQGACEPSSGKFLCNTWPLEKSFS